MQFTTPNAFRSYRFLRRRRPKNLTPYPRAGPRYEHTRTTWSLRVAHGTYVLDDKSCSRYCLTKKNGVAIVSGPSKKAVPTDPTVLCCIIPRWSSGTIPSNAATAVALIRQVQIQQWG